MEEEDDSEEDYYTLAKTLIHEVLEFSKGYKRQTRRRKRNSGNEEYVKNIRGIPTKKCSPVREEIEDSDEDSE